MGAAAYSAEVWVARDYRAPVATRLSRAVLTDLPADVRRPAADPPRVGIVHLGIGAFHRAHQAVFTEDASDGSDGWGIVGVTQRSATVRDQLLPQDCLYTLLERGDGAAGPRVVGAVRDVRSARDEPRAVVELIADPAVHVVTLTVTEKGYRRAADGDLDLDDPAVVADVAGAGPSTPVGTARARTAGATTPWRRPDLRGLLRQPREQRRGSGQAGPQLRCCSARG